jgi:hypothetical protein
VAVGVEEEEHLAPACAAKESLSIIRHDYGLADADPDLTDIPTEPALHATRQSSEALGGRPDVRVLGLRQVYWFRSGLSIRRGCALGFCPSPSGGWFVLAFIYQPQAQVVGRSLAVRFHASLKRTAGRGPPLSPDTQARQSPQRDALPAEPVGHANVEQSLQPRPSCQPQRTAFSPGRWIVAGGDLVEKAPDFQAISSVLAQDGDNSLVERV